MSMDATPPPVWLTQWSNGRRMYMVVTEKPEFAGLLPWEEGKGGSWKFDPAKSRLRPKLGLYWFKDQQP